jgi:tetratricopeptide (TPR) repeat protein
VLISEQGEIIGITTYNFSGAQYALVSAAVDNVPRLNALVTGESTAFAERRPFGQEAQLTFDARLPGQFSTDIYVLDVAPREEVELEVEGNGRPQISVTSAVGWQVAASEPSLNRVQRVRFTAKEDEGPYFVTISHLSRFRNDYTLTSSHPLSALNDPDDQQRFTDQAFTSGESYWGSMDAPGDLDIYPLKLEKGQEVVVEVDAMGVQPYIRLLVETQAQNALYIQADGGEDGVFGEKAQLVFAAPQTGTYRFLVDSSGYDVGGYRISVRAATDDDTLTEAVNESEFYFSRYGLQEQYESDANPFIIRYPARWQSTACNQNATACFSGGDVGALIIAEENLAASGVLRGDATLADYVDLLEEMLTANPTVIEMVQRGDFTTQSGLTGELLVSVLPGNRLEMLRFVYVEDEVAFNATYIYPQRLSETWRDIFEFQLTSFRIGDEELEEGSARYYVEEAQQHYLRRDYAAALSALDKAIELDDTLADAFFTRALVRQQRGELDAAIADQLRLIELDPDHAPNFSQLAQLYWQAGQTEEAVAASDKVLELEPEQPGEHNNRALFYATLNDSERALAETVSYAELLDDELPPHALDTRAYIYLKEDRLEEAQADYVAALEEDFQSPYTLLGAGVTAARLGDGARAVDLIEYGFELLAEQDSLWAQHLTPQLQDLVEWADAVLAQNGR